MRPLLHGRRSVSVSPAPLGSPSFSWLSRQSWQSYERGRRSYRRLILGPLMIRSVSLTTSRTMLRRMGLACILD